jgi:hypothetical protein
LSTPWRGRNLLKNSQAPEMRLWCRRCRTSLQWMRFHAGSFIDRGTRTHWWSQQQRRAESREWSSIFCALTGSHRPSILLALPLLSSSRMMSLLSSPRPLRLTSTTPTGLFFVGAAGDVDLAIVDWFPCSLSSSAAPKL